MEADHAKRPANLIEATAMPAADVSDPLHVLVAAVHDVFSGRSVPVLAVPDGVFVEPAWARHLQDDVQSLW